jgi:hypothetical protein
VQQELLTVRALADAAISSGVELSAVCGSGADASHVSTVLNTHQQLSTALAALYRDCFFAEMYKNNSAVVAIPSVALAALQTVTEFADVVEQHVPKATIHTSDSNRHYFDIKNYKGKVEAVNVVRQNGEQIIDSVLDSIYSGEQFMLYRKQCFVEQLNLLLSVHGAYVQRVHGDTTLRASLSKGKPSHGTAVPFVRIWKGCMRDVRYNDRPCFDVHIKYGEVVVMHALALHAGAPYTAKISGRRLHAAVSVQHDGVCSQVFPVDCTFFDDDSVVDSIAEAAAAAAKAQQQSRKKKRRTS